MIRRMKSILGIAAFAAFVAGAQAHAALPPNEMGKFMVLMYHHIGVPESEWQRTPDNFRADLQLLYSKGYYLTNLMELADGTIDVPAGKSPVVLTFDDAAVSQFRKVVNARGEEVWDPDSAVGILKAFHDKHPDFGLAGTFYLNAFKPPVSTAEKILKEMVAMGFELGNHTLHHANLKKLSRDGVEQAIGGLVKWVDSRVPGYAIRSLALPFGIAPADRAWAANGDYQGVRYRNEIILNVGDRAAPSPYSAKFNPISVPRVRASDPYLGQELKKLDSNPAWPRFVSDGDPATVTVPAALAAEVSAEARRKFRVVIR